MFSSDNIFMMTVFAWFCCSFFLFRNCNAILPILSLPKCTSYSCMCLLNTKSNTELAEVNQGENITSEISIRTPQSYMDELYQNKSNVAIVRYNKIVSRSYWFDDEYSERWSVMFRFEPSVTGCGVLMIRPSVCNALFKDEGIYHLELTLKNMIYTTRETPLTLYVNSGQQQNMTRGDMDVKAPMAEQETIMNQEAVSPSVITSIQWATFAFSLATFLMLLVLLPVLIYKKKRNDYEPI